MHSVYSDSIQQPLMLLIVSTDTEKKTITAEIYIRFTQAPSAMERQKSMLGVLYLSNDLRVSNLKVIAKEKWA